MRIYTLVISALIGCVLSLSAYADNQETESCGDQNTPCIEEHGLKIEIVKSGRGEVSFPVHYTFSVPKTQKDIEKCQNTDESYTAAECEAGKFTCDENVGYVVFKDAQGILTENEKTGLALVNQKLKDLANSRKCDDSTVSLGFTPTHVYAKAPLVSTVFFYYSLCAGCGGGCHGEALVGAFNIGGKNAATPLTVRSIVNEKKYPAIKAALLKELLNSNSDIMDDNSNKQAREYLDEHLLKDSFFIEKNKVMVNIGGFIFSCADGPFHPVELPKKFIKPEFLALLTKENG